MIVLKRERESRLCNFLFNFFFFGKEEKQFFIRYGGCYNGGLTKDIMVPTILNYCELSATLYEFTKVSSSEFKIITRVKYKLDCDYPPVCIMDEGDVRFLLSEMDRNRPPIFVSFEEMNEDVTF